MYEKSKSSSSSSESSASKPNAASQVVDPASTSFASSLIHHSAILSVSSK